MSAIESKARVVVRVWNEQCGRVFESMGRDNPRAGAIDKAMRDLEKEFTREHNLNQKYPE